MATRLRNAVTSLVVDVMPTTFHPSADFWVRMAARADGSFDGALAVANSNIGRTVSRNSACPYQLTDIGVTRRSVVHQFPVA